MANQIFMRVNEVAEELGVSVPYAYKLIRQMNEELAKTGCITISGRIYRKFFHEKFYGTRTETAGKGLCHKARDAGMGTGVPDGKAGRC